LIFYFAVVGVESEFAVVVMGHVDFRILLGDLQLLRGLEEQLHFLAIGVAFATTRSASAITAASPAPGPPAAQSATTASASLTAI